MGAKNEDKIFEIMGFIGFWGMIVIAIYLALKVLGVVHPVELNEVVAGVAISQVFYNGYLFRVASEIKEIKNKVGRIEEKVIRIEERLASRRRG